MAKFQFSGGGGRGRVPKLKILKVPRNGEISIFGGGGGRGRVPKLKILKVPRNGEISIFAGGVLSALGLCQVKTQSAKICLNFNFRGGGTLRILNQIFNHSS